jgi:cytochrome c-type biogenesis protein CcmH/NrfG
MAEPFTDKPDNNVFQEAVYALRRADKPRAKKLLTDLLKDDQNNATYWIWLSAAVDNSKERIYCLQTALKLDPANGTAKRGLILLGALPPDETVQPFPMNRPRAWEDKLLLANEKPKEKGLKISTRNPVVRLMGVVLIGVALCAAVIFGFILPRRSNVHPTRTNTPGPSPTFTFTPTLLGAVAAATSTYVGPTPLWAMLPATYTPTPLYVNTPRNPQAMDQFRSAKAAYEKGDWDLFIQNMELIARAEPNSADVYYYLGEAYRFKREASNALKAYNTALQINPKFGPPYLGLARARLIQDANANVDYLFTEAISRDPNFGEIYLERARYYIFHNNPKAALVDLDRANKLLPNSPEVFLTYANAYLASNDQENALKSAEKAYSLDITNLSIYSLLGELYVKSGDYQRAVDALELYVIYKDQDAHAFALLGQAYYELKNYKAAVTSLNTAFTLNSAGSRRFYVYRGLANLELNNIDQALIDLEGAFEVDKSSYSVNLGLLRVYYIQEKFGNAFLKAETLKSLTTTDRERAEVLYWRALVQEKRGEKKDAVASWQEILKMDASVMTSKMRLEAEQHLKEVITPTNTPKGGTGTPTPKAGSATRTPTP